VIIAPGLRTGQGEQERGGAALDDHQKDQIVDRLARRSAQRGDTVQLEPVTAAAT
jgi:hypothetical protein